ncbi:hypothetical protein H2O64_06420 [Kordia sp. YSTF-M3]|uniref:Uncharacterized protein n=1 Tax=Kordia aestuariivivens TaxID=2759037 RepID=A0ABR7Q782_9FLAO|nr:hypothetical protein [Kordia aestuariivivens]MBC8754298.1 hypothetical protein [Kordia aestuariivivens]
MKKLIIRVAFAAAILFSGVMLFQIENVDAQTDAQTVESRLGKWISIYQGGQNPTHQECIAHYTAECRTGDTRKVPIADAGPAVPINN